MKEENIQLEKDVDGGSHTSEKDPGRDVDPQAVMAGLSYLSVLIFIPILMPGTNDYVRHHLQQGIILFVIGVIASLFAWIWLPLWVVANLAVLVASVYGFFQAVQGKRWVMPVIGRYARKLKI